MSATFRIIQDSVNGEWGIARQDITLVGVGGTVTLEAQDQTAASYVWEVLTEPEGATAGASIVTPVGGDAWVAEIDLDLTGGYLVRLTVDPGLPTEDISILYLGIPLAGSGLCIPALNETIFDNSYAAGGSGDTYVGYERKNTAILKWMDENTGAAGLFEEVAGSTQSVRRLMSSAVVNAGNNDIFTMGSPHTLLGSVPNTFGATEASPYSFAFGTGNSLDGWVAGAQGLTGYAGNVVFGAGNQVRSVSTFVFGLMNEINEVAGAVVLGNNNLLDGYFSGGSVSVIGTGNTVKSYNSFVAGSDNSVPSSSSSSVFILGNSNGIIDAKDECVLLGTNLSSKKDGATVLGKGASAKWEGALIHSSDSATYGNCQTTINVELFAVTTPAEPDATMELAGSSTAYLDTQTNGVYLVEMMVIANERDTTGLPGGIKTWSFRFTARQDYDGDAYILAPIDKTILNATAISTESTWDVAVDINTLLSENPIRVQVTGSPDAAQSPLCWSASLRVLEYTLNA